MIASITSLLKEKKTVWTIIRILLFIYIGVKSLVQTDIYDETTWQYYMGYVFLIAAAVDTYFILMKIYRLQSGKKNEG